MVGKEDVDIVDEEIRRAELALQQSNLIPRTREVVLKKLPSEVISRINEMDSVIIEFEER